MERPDGRGRAGGRGGYAGAVTWILDDKALQKLNGWVARKTSIINGNTVREECAEPTVNIGYRIRARRRDCLHGRTVNIGTSILCSSIYHTLRYEPPLAAATPAASRFDQRKLLWLSGGLGG